MSRLQRPYIPVAVRAQVAARQAIAAGFAPDTVGLLQRTLGPGRFVAVMLGRLFPVRCAELHHRPALVNRPRHERKVGGKVKVYYTPPANDPDHLFYLAEDTHDVETRVRGLHGQHSDLGLVRKAKAIARNRDPKRRRVQIRSRGFHKGGPHRGWPKRKMRGKS